MRIFILTLLLLSSSAFAKDKINFCHQSLAESTNLTFTEIFFSYLNELYKEKIVTDQTLTKLKLDLEKQSSLTNPATNTSSSDYKIHTDMVKDYLNNPELDRPRLLGLLTEFLNKQKETSENKKRAAEKTEIAFKTIKFHLIKKGSFPEMRFVTVGEGPTAKVEMKEFQTEVPHSFLMMDTHVTRNLWSKVYGQIIINNKIADLPMVDITFLSAMAFANELSKREGLKPVYILNPEILNPDTKAENGTLALKRTSTPPQDFPSTTFIDAPNGDIYQTEGYRLPSIHEQFFVRTSRGQVKNTQFFPGVKSESNQNNVLNYAWLQENSGELQVVATLLPFIIDGNKFYDLYGNAFEYTHNTYNEIFRPYFFGSAFSTNKSDVLDLTSTVRPKDLFHSYNDIGFRLVRTVKPEKKP